jgi:5,10-methenyltetrahydromethanopterin hydrogenase
MNITPNQDFLDDVNRYEKGVTYDVPNTKAAVFIANGWADEGTAEEVAERGSAAPTTPIPTPTIAVADGQHN